MDIFLFFVGLLCLFNKRRHLTIAIIILLASTYLQLPLQPTYSVGHFPFIHNIHDTALLLYLIMFIPLLFKRSTLLNGRLQNIVTLFFAFLVLNGIYDICSGVSVGDVIRYVKGWGYLTLIYVYKSFTINEIVKSFKIICYITFIFSLVITIASIFDLDFLSEFLVSKGGRGYKPPSYSIICLSAYLINLFKVKETTRYAYIIVYIIPIVLNAKMTYLISVLLIVIMYVLLSRTIKGKSKMLITIISSIVVFALFTINDNIGSRFKDLSSGVTSAVQGEVDDNFSYRLLHAGERLDYILSTPKTALRGIGYISEVNYKETTFELGVWNATLDRVDQLNNGDIVWSNFFLRLGFIGLILYLGMYIAIVRAFYQSRDLATYNVYFYIVMIVFLLFTSLGNDLIGYSDFFIYPILFMNTCKYKI